MQTELFDPLGEPVAIATQRTPRQCQREGFTGLIQHPEAYSIDLLTAVYGIPFPTIPYDYDPPLPIDPIPECSDEVSDYLLSFHESARRIAMHPRIVDRLQRRSPWFCAEDMPQAAIEYLLCDPARYALEDSHQGARLAVRDILDDMRNGNRTLIDDARIDRKQVTLRESIPDDRPDYVDPDDEVSRIMSLGVVSAKSAHIAIALASGSTREIIAESLGVNRARVYQLRRQMQAEIIVYGSALGADSPS
jgi:hypothetical protein